MVNLTKQYKFCAAHRYWNEEWSAEKNDEVFEEIAQKKGVEFFKRDKGIVCP